MYSSKVESNSPFSKAETVKKQINVRYTFYCKQYFIFCIMQIIINIKISFSKYNIRKIIILYCYGIHRY